MEQRIGSNSQPQQGEPVKGAGFDPAFIPGITGPAATVAAEPEDARPAEAEDTKPSESAESPESSDAPAPADAAEAADGDGASGGPVFEASDRRAKIVANRQGVQLSLDKEACEFRWNEIAAVQTESARFGKRFTVTVHTPDKRWYPIEIEASARSRFKEWEDQLDAVLDAYFEEA